MSNENKVKLPKNFKGKKASFYKNPEIDQVMSILITLTQELSVAYDRIYTLEKVLEKKGIIETNEIENWIPTDNENTIRSKNIDDLLSRVFHLIHEEAEETSIKR